LAAAGLVDRLDAGRAGRPRDTLEVVLARRVIGKADEFRLALLGDVDVVRAIGAAHIERRAGALCARHAEAREKLLHDIEVGGLDRAVGLVGALNESHARYPNYRASRQLCINRSRRHPSCSVSRMRCSVERVGAERCTADPGPPRTITVPGLQRATTQSSVRRLRKLICGAALRPGHDTASPNSIP